MTAPHLSRLLTLEERQRAPDGAGGFSDTWVPLGELWAELKAGSGGERRGEAVTLSTASYRITVRAAPQGAPSRPKPDQRFRDGSRVFRILAVSDGHPKARFLTCHAREEVTG